MRRASLWLVALLGASALAQGSVSGTVFAPSVAGLSVIACYLSGDGCDEARSGFAVIGAGGAYRIDGLGPGPFLVLLWHDADGDGEASETELTVYGGDAPQLVTAPATGIDFVTVAVQAPAPQPPAGPLVGNWYQGSVSTVDYYSPSTGTWAPPSGTGFRYEFRSDGSYTYSGMMQSSLYSCTMTLFSYQTGRWATQDQVLAVEPDLHKFKSTDTCNAQYNYEKDVELEPSYYLFELGRDTSGEPTLNLTSLILNAQGELELDPEYADAGASVFYRSE
jgi:hypothetical protein